MIRCGELYEILLGRHGRQGWWPAHDPFEIIVGALLVQRTTWLSVEVAIRELRQNGLLSPYELETAPREVIESCIRSVGFFRTKSARLQGLAAFVAVAGGIDALQRVDTPVLRRRLLELEGVGPETADAILLYAFERPAVVVDAYLRRLIERLTGTETTDADIRRWVTRDLAQDAERLNELHALVVAHARETCTGVPRCSSCILRRVCRTGAARGSDT